MSSINTQLTLGLLLHNIDSTISHGPTKDKTLDFMVGQFLQQSSMSSQDQFNISKKASQIIDSEGSFTEKWKKVRGIFSSEQSFYGKQFDEYSSWFGRSEGLNFINNDIPSMGKISIPTSSFKNSVMSSSINEKESEALFGQLQNRKIGKRVLNRITGKEHTFSVGGVRQTSRTYNVQVNIPHINKSYNLNLFEPSEFGFLANDVNAGYSMGTAKESIYAVPKRFGIDLDKNMKLIQSMSSGKEHGYMKFQMDVLDQLQGYLESIHQNPQVNRSPEAFEKIVDDAFKLFEQTMTSQQYYAGTSQEMQMLHTLDSNRFAKIISQQENLNIVPTFSPHKERFAVGGKDVFRALAVNNIPAVSAAQAGNTVESIYGGLVLAPKTVPRDLAVDFGYDFPHYRELHKQLGEQTPLEVISQSNIPNTGLKRTSNLLPGAYKGNQASKFSQEVFNPKGINTVVSFIGNVNQEALPMEISLEALRETYPDISREELVKMKAQIDSGLAKSNMLMPDGTMISKQSLASSSGVAYVTSENLRLTGPGGAGKNYMGESIDALISGKTITHSVGGRELEFSVLGLNKAEGDFGKAMKIQNISDPNYRDILQRELDTFGMPVKRGSYMGLDQQGYQVSASNRANVQQYIFQATPTDENISLRMFNTTQQVSEDGKLIDQINKFIGGPENRIKVTANYVDEKAFSEIAGAQIGKDVESLLMADKIKNPLERILYQSGAARYNLGKRLNDTRMSADTNIAKVIDTVASMNNEELLSIVGGSYDYEKTGNQWLQKELRPFTNNLSGTMDYRLADFTDRLLEKSGASNLEREESIKNLYSFYNKWGEQTGIDRNAERYTSWGKGASTTNITSLQEVEFAQRKFKAASNHEVMMEELQELGGRLMRNQNDFADEVVRNNKAISSVLTLGIRDDANLLGMGQKATFEPRYIDVATGQKYLTQKSSIGLSPMEEVTSRMTNYVPAIEEINRSLNFHQTGNNVALDQYKKSPIIGKVPVNIDLGLNEEKIGAINHYLETRGPHSTFTAGNNVYLPSEESISAMGQMRGGLSLEKNKPLREIYSNFFDEINDLKRSDASPEAFGRKFLSFEEDLLNYQKTQLMGKAGGSQHGALRGPIHGSGVAYNVAYSDELSRSLGLLKSDKRVNSFMKTQRASFYNNMRQQGIGRQVFASESMINKMFSDAIRNTEENIIGGRIDNTLGEEMIAQYRSQLNKLRSGEGVGMLAIRDPAINRGSISGMTVYMDRASRGSRDLDYMSTSQSFASITTDGKTSNKAISLLADLAGDHDGDRIKLIALTEANAKQVSERLSRDALYNEMNSARTQVMKEQIIESIGFRSEELKRRRGTVALSEAEKSVNQVLAQASPKTIVPRVSNALTEMKYSVALSSLDESVKDMLYNFLYLPEQVPVSGKHFEKQVEFGDELISSFQNIRSKFLDRDKYQEGIDDLMKLIASDQKGNLRSSSEVIVEHLGKQKKFNLDYQVIKDQLSAAAKQMHENEANIDILSQLRSKAALKNVNQQEMDGLYRQLGVNLKGIHFRANEIENIGTAGRSYAEVSAREIEKINKGLIEEGMSRASGNTTKLGGIGKMKGSALMAAAGITMAAGAGLGMMLSPTKINNQNQHIDPDFLFPDEFDKIDPNLHSNGLMTPKGVVAHGSYQAQIHLPPGARVPENLAGRLGMMAENAVASLNIYDHRMSLDANKIDKIKREII